MSRCDSATECLSGLLGLAHFRSRRLVSTVSVRLQRPLLKVRLSREAPETNRRGDRTNSPTPRPAPPPNLTLLTPISLTLPDINAPNHWANSHNWAPVIKSAKTNYRPIADQRLSCFGEEDASRTLDLSVGCLSSERVLRWGKLCMGFEGGEELGFLHCTSWRDGGDSEDTRAGDGLQFVLKSRVWWDLRLIDRGVHVCMVLEVQVPKCTPRLARVSLPEAWSQNRDFKQW